MPRPDPRPTSIVDVATRCVGPALILMMLVACTDIDDDVPTPTAINQVQSTTATVEVLPPPSWGDGGRRAHSRPQGDLGADTDWVTVEDGYIADGEMLSPFDSGHPAISNLEINLLESVRQASADAALDGVDLLITSGWRSERYQQYLLDEAIATYGSEAEARKWVNTPEQSTHVQGYAVDIGPTAAYDWLSQHGNGYGLCQIYVNELWHYELATVPGGTCPPQISDASAGR